MSSSPPPSYANPIPTAASPSTPTRATSPLTAPTATATFASPPLPTSSQAAILLSPVPCPIPVPTIALPHTFVHPAKRISAPSDLQHFLSSPTSSSFLSFISSLSHSSLNLKFSDPLSPFSPHVSSLLDLLHFLSSSISSFPPSPHPSRYGNPSFRLWHHHLVSEAPRLVSSLLTVDLHPAIPEIVPYLLDSFGNATRIDYGTGHEANFAAFLYCLARIGIVTDADYPALVLRVFVSYLDLMRKLQDTYWLEPAGSHGVWGLDDYHFLPYIFGSAQLMDHKYMKPKSIHNDDILENFSKEYFYFDCVRRVKQVKKGPFAEHSPMLNDISGVPSWRKVNSGLLKMYRAEVLEKLPIMQHFLFGSLLKW